MTSLLLCKCLEPRVSFLDYVFSFNWLSLLRAWSKGKKKEARAPLKQVDILQVHPGGK